MRVTPSATFARFSESTQFTAIAAATPTPPPCSPDSSELLPFASVVLSLAFGRSPVPLSLVFGLSLTCAFDLSSEFFSLLSDESAPLAEAFASEALFIVDDARIWNESAFMLRAISAFVSQKTMTLIATFAPTAVSSPSALASPFVPDASIVCVALTLTSPVAVHVLPEPTRATVLSSTSSASATAGVIAVPPLEPALTAVTTVRSLLAETVTSSPFEIATPFSISARVSVEKRMLSAIEAPTPTSPPSAAASALAVSDSTCDAVRDTSPVPALTVVWAPLTAVRR